MDQLPLPSHNTIIWNNLAFISDNDEQSSIGRNRISSSHPKEEKSSLGYSINANEEELRIREELAEEIERELKREIMEGILALVHRLSDLKVKQITRRLKVVDLDQFVDDLFALNCCNLSKVSGYDGGSTSEEEEIYYEPDIESSAG